MSALIPPHRQYTVPHITLAEIEWFLARGEARRLVGDDRLAEVAGRVGMTPEEALDYLAMAPRWVLTEDRRQSLEGMRVLPEVARPQCPKPRQHSEVTTRVAWPAAGSVGQTATPSPRFRFPELLERIVSSLGGTP